MSDGPNIHSHHEVSQTPDAPHLRPDQLTMSPPVALDSPAAIAVAAARLAPERPALMPTPERLALMPSSDREALILKHMEEEVGRRRASIGSVWAEATKAYESENYSEIPRLAKFITSRFVTDQGNEIRLSPFQTMPPFPEVIAKAQQKERDHIRQTGFADKVEQIDRPGPEYNCWGFTFTGGAGWLDSPQDVQRILVDNGYRVTTQPRSGDVIVYRTPDTGEITHTGIVTKVEQLPNGTRQATEIYSKWGLSGLYRHAPGDAPSEFGTWRIYQSDRPGGALLTPKPLAKKMHTIETKK